MDSESPSFPPAPKLLLPRYSVDIKFAMNLVASAQWRELLALLECLNFHTQAHRVTENVKATVSPMMAELMSVLDRAIAVVPVDRRKTSAVCELSGVRLDQLPSSMVVEHGGAMY